jgi:hypothetical protein
MMASGLEKQLVRCDSGGAIPSFCNDTTVYRNVVSAYDNLWDSIEANSDLLRTEVWSWVYNNGFQNTLLRDLPAPGGAAQTESDIIQVISQDSPKLMWSVVESNSGIRSFEESGAEITEKSKNALFESFVHNL